MRKSQVGALGTNMIAAERPCHVLFWLFGVFQSTSYWEVPRSGFAKSKRKRQNFKLRKQESHCRLLLRARQPPVHQTPRPTSGDAAASTWAGTSPPELHLSLSLSLSVYWSGRRRWKYNFSMLSMCVLLCMMRITKLSCRVLTQMTKFLIIVILVKLEKFAAVR